MATFVRCLFVLVMAAHPWPGAAAAEWHFPYTRTLWRTADGLPEATVQALTETGDGLLWIGTTGGLASFDGAHLRPQASGSSLALGVNSIFCLSRDPDGSFWAGTEGGGLLHVRGDDTSHFSANQGLTDGFVRSILRDARGTLWVGTDNGLFRMQAGRFERVDDGVAVPHLAVHALTADRQGTLWVGGSQLLSIDAHGTTRLYPLPGAYGKSRVKTILQTADGTIWVGTVGGLQRRVGTHFEAVPAISSTVRTLLQTRDGRLWIGTIGDGLWTMGLGAPRPLHIPRLLPSDTVLAMLQDDDGQLWIGTQACMVRLSRTPVGIVPLQYGGDPDFETISGDSSGDVWVAAQGLWTIRGDAAVRLTLPQLGQASVRNVFRAHDGALWIGTDGSGAFRLDGGAVRHLSAPGELTNNFIRGFLETRDGAIWIATDEGVSRISGDSISKFTEATGLVYVSTRCLLEDHTGAVWIGTDRGVSLWRAGHFESNGITAALSHEKVWSILEDRGNVLWFATRDHGLFRWKDGQLDQFNTVQGLPGNSVYTLLQDRRGVFWMTGPDHIASIGEAEMEQPSAGPKRPLSVTVYGMPFGADGAEMYGGRQPAGFVSGDTVWFPTSRGAAFIRTQGLPGGGAPPRAIIRPLEEDGRSVPLGSNLRIPAGVTRVSLGFSAVFLRAQSGLRFRYRLEPLEHDWNAATAEDTATYTNLAAGHYRFVVQAFAASDPHAVSQTEFSFVKSPFFYETWWFYTLALVGVLGLTALVYWLHVEQIRKRFQAVLAERNRLAREMHDTVIQGCTGISALLEAMASKADGALDAELLGYARSQVRTTIEEARHVVWDMRQDEKTVDLADAMRALAEQSTREQGAPVTLAHEEASLSLGTSTAHEILMAVREAVYNATQHSGSPRIELSLFARSDEFTVQITDFGGGFDPGKAPGTRAGHFGMVGMQERMKRIGGQFELRSAPGAGTTVSLRLRKTRRVRSRLRQPDRV